MEDLTPTKRIKKDRKDSKLATVHSPGLRSLPEEEATARIGRFMLVVAWRRRRDEIRCLRKTLESQVSCSERLRIQVCVLKSLLDSDNDKVRQAMRELDRLKNLLKDRDAEKAVLEKEKYALEQDVSSAEDRASEMSIGWRNCRNELECLRAAHACLEQALSLERAASQDARAHADTAFQRLSSLEEELSQHEALLASAHTQAAALRRDHDHKLRQLDQVTEQLELERAARERCSRERSVLSARASLTAQQTSALRGVVEDLRAQLRHVELELKTTREQLDWWPRPLTKMLGAARSWFRHPLSIQEAVLWSFIPARHGC
ncbi:paramyosin [Maniola hyperantus]|uniref:paramyosin n=1 Tax=Aphantopus hyperantus TaxID=2795564 RepID=UPI003749BB67